MLLSRRWGGTHGSLWISPALSYPKKPKILGFLGDLVRPAMVPFSTGIFIAFSTAGKSDEKAVGNRKFPGFTGFPLLFPGVEKATKNRRSACKSGGFSQRWKNPPKRLDIEPIGPMDQPPRPELGLYRKWQTCQIRYDLSETGWFSLVAQIRGKMANLPNFA
jgi:hypothetical protein